MRTLFLAGAAALALTAGPMAIAQTTTTTTTTETMQTQEPTSTVPGSTNSVKDKRGGYEMTTEQRTVYQTWTTDRQADYDTWPMDYQEYYWTLGEPQQEGYWAMTADQRGRIYEMTPEQQQLAWKSVVAQLNGQTPATPAGQANPPGQGMPTNGVPNPQSANQAVQPAMPADTSYQGGPYKGAMTPPPADAMNKDYPICSATVKDSCINPREAGKNYGNRPLDYWPGKPASEMDDTDG